MSHATSKILVVFLMLFSGLCAADDPAAPAELQQWRDWVLQPHAEHDCPWLLTRTPARACIWPGRLALEATPGGLDFSYRIEVFRDGALVPLPGGTASWPRHVTVDSDRGPVLDRAGTPHVLLDSGSHVVAGEIRWTRRPARLAVPESIALLRLTQSGHSRSPERNGGHIVLGGDDSNNAARQARERDSLDIEVFRKLTDGVPMTLQTRLVLTVSGEAREVEFGRVAWPDTVLMAIDSPLPARLEDQGKLRVQLRPGRHTINLESRVVGPRTEFSASSAGAPWPQFEYLSFAGNSDLRQVSIGGAPAVDTSQVSVPAAWKTLPTWRLDAQSTLHLSTEYRGDQSPAANDIAIQRELWLDFDGGALTGLESVSGSMRRGWRLDTRADTRLGSARVAGQPVLVTRHAGNEGVEIRSPGIELQAVTRIASPTRFSATGWHSRADSFRATLHIPPGWRVLHAAGVDGIATSGGSWLAAWDLWDIFLVLILVAATHQLLGLKAAALALLTLLVGYHEPGMPRYLLALLVLLLPLSAVAGGRIKRGLSVVAALTGALLLLALLAFSIEQFRLAIYPSLERSAVGLYQQAARSGTSVSVAAGIGADYAQPEAAAELGSPQNKMLAAVPAPATRYELGEDDRVQTGPGVPNWLWQQLHLRASGPVPESAELSFIYSPPALTRVWRVLSVLFALAYAGLLGTAILRRLRGAPPNAAAGPSGSQQPQEPQGPPAGAPSSTPAVLLLVGALALAGLPGTSQAQIYPPQYLLDQLAQRLLQPPECAPHCVSLDQGLIDTREDALTLSFSAYAAADVLLPLPTPREGWQVARIELDGNADNALRRQGSDLAVLLPQGHHTVSMTGELFGETASIRLPAPIHNIATSGEHWQVSGLVDGRVPSGTLSLRALSAVRQQAGSTLTPEPVPAFFRVHREFDIGLQWRVITRVTRLAPAAGPVAVAVPLLSSERLLSDHIRVADGRARLQFGDRQQNITWESSMDPVDQLQLLAAADSHYVESWRLRPSALWRVDHSGVPPVRADSDQDKLQPLWKPWPGESLTLNFTRPEGVAGPTHTVEQATLAYQAGNALRKSVLTLSIRASIGQDYLLELPDDARVTALSRNGNALNLPASPQISVALQPGEQIVKVSFEQDGGAGWLSSTPRVQLSGGASNITLSYSLPRDRWPLYLTGPDIGPAMLYWGVFCVIVLGAVLLSALNRRLHTGLPIGLPGWLLLGIGLSTVNSYGVLVVAVFFFVLAFRQRVGPANMSRASFNLMQVALGLGAAITLATLLSAIPLGLLASPEMLVTGNNSGSHLYQFFQDRAGAEAFPTATVLSVPLLAYRIVMLLWSLWLASRLIRWIAWAWQAYGHKGVWVSKRGG